MSELVTVFSSNIPVECHILKGRLESDGICCFLYDNHIVEVHPFYAVMVGGVKLKVPADQVILAQEIIGSFKQGWETDEQSEYIADPGLEWEIERQNEILVIKNKIRKHSGLLDKPDGIKTIVLDQEDINQVLAEEKSFHELSICKRNLSWQQFCSELFDFDRDFFRYLRPRPAEYYVEKEIVDNYFAKSDCKSTFVCPNCKSDNVRNGYAMDIHSNILFLILSFIFYAPFPWFRKKWHCFNCGFNYK